MYDPEEVGLLFDAFLILWEIHELPGEITDIRKYFNKVELHWQPFVFESLGLPDSGALWGLTSLNLISGYSEVYVYDWSDDKPSLGKTSLTHELIHIALFATTGDIHSRHHEGSKRFSPELEDFKDNVNLLF